MLDLNDSDVYTPSWRLWTGLLAGFCAVVALPAGVCFLLSWTVSSSSKSSSASSPTSSSSSNASSPFIETSLLSAASSASLLPDDASFVSSKPAKLLSLSFSESLCSSFLRLTAGGAMIADGVRVALPRRKISVANFELFGGALLLSISRTPTVMTSWSCALVLPLTHVSCTCTPPPPHLYCIGHADASSL